MTYRTIVGSVVCGVCGDKAEVYLFELAPEMGQRILRFEAMAKVVEAARILARHDPGWCPGCDPDSRDLEEEPHQPDCAEQNLRLALKALDEVWS